MARTHTVPPGSINDGLCVGMTDAQYHGVTDTSCSIADAYTRLGRMSNPSSRMLDQARTFGLKSRISGPVKGDPPADGHTTAGWQLAGLGRRATGK